MYIFNSMASLNAATLLEGDIVQVLGETNAFDKPVLIGKVMPASYVTSNRVELIANGLKVEFEPQNIVVSPNGTKYHISVSDTGVLSAVAI